MSVHIEMENNTQWLKSCQINGTGNMRVGEWTRESL